ncbi:MAG: Crp/Fnr family transcriptional regulator [Flavobacteriaceae bacterium]
MISEELLITYGSILKQYRKDDVIFEKNNTAKFFYQIHTGTVKMYNRSEDGKEFVLGYFHDTQSFAEPPLFGDFEYPANAEATEDSSIYVLNKTAFFNLLKDHFDIHLQLNKILCERIKYKSMMMSEISINSSEHQLMSLLLYFKKNANAVAPYEIGLTRQQLADLTGLRVETVIRTIKSLAAKKKLEIINRKIYI